jgi:hypothetical protein
MAQNEISDSTKSIVTLLLLIFAFPVGVIVMWFWPKWAKWVKILVTAPIVLVLLGGIVIGFLSTTDINTQVKKGACAKQCETSQMKDTCIMQCMGTINAPPSYSDTESQ